MNGFFFSRARRSHRNCDTSDFLGTGNSNTHTSWFGPTSSKGMGKGFADFSTRIRAFVIMRPLPNVQDEPRPWLARAVLLGARIVTAMVVGSSALLGRLFMDLDETELSTFQEREAQRGLRKHLLLSSHEQPCLSRCRPLGYRLGRKC